MVLSDGHPSLVLFRITATSICRARLDPVPSSAPRALRWASFVPLRLADRKLSHRERQWLSQGHRAGSQTQTCSPHVTGAPPQVEQNSPARQEGTGPLCELPHGACALGAGQLWLLQNRTTRLAPLGIPWGVPEGRTRARVHCVPLPGFYSVGPREKSLPSSLRWET